MLLESLAIKNFRSLEAVDLAKLGTLNVLIGRNNSGKSSILNALAYAGRSITGGGYEQWSAFLTDEAADRAIEMRFVFRPTASERAQLLGLLESAGAARDATHALDESPFARQLAYSFVGHPGQAQVLHLREVALIAQDNAWVGVFALGTEESTASGNPLSQLVNLDHLAIPSPALFRLDSARLSNALVAGPLSLRLQPFAGWPGPLGAIPPASRWILEQLHTYFAGAYFLSPFRHSTPVSGVAESRELAPDGSNLAQTLHTIQSNDRGLFNSIEEFIHAALPDVGQLQAPLTGSATYVGFLRSRGVPHVRLTEMGGGVEQLLMLAVVLTTTADDRALFVEEPETHLHPGAQRFLLERFAAGTRQVTVATHSSVFLDPRQAPLVYRTRLSTGRTAVGAVTDSQAASDLFDDLGVRYSDVLLSDAVLYVEGSSDRDVLLQWSELKGSPLAASGVNVVPIGGGEAQGARIRSAGLKEISAKSPIPHLIVLDADERSEREVLGLREALGERVWILERRELENYLLVPAAILSALLDKHRDDGPMRARLAIVSADEIERAIDEITTGLFGLVLIKRIRAEIGLLRDGLLPRDGLSDLAIHHDAPDLTDRLIDTMRRVAEAHIDATEIASMVGRQHTELLNAWSDPDARRRLAPGEEVLKGVFSRLGGEFNKRIDSARVARYLAANDIAPEMAQLLVAAVRLGNKQVVPHPAG